MARLDRTNFYRKFNIDGIIESDLINNYWDSFELKRNITYCEISRSFIGKPQLISFKYFGVVDYWWIILKINNIDDPWNGLVLGDQIKIPDPQDIEDWIIEIKKRRRDENFNVK